MLWKEIYDSTIRSIDISFIDGDPDECGSKTLGAGIQLVPGVLSITPKICLADQIAVANDQEAMEVQLLSFNHGQHLREPLRVHPLLFGSRSLPGFG